MIAVGVAGLKDALIQFTHPQCIGSVLVSKERRKMHRCSTDAQWQAPTAGTHHKKHGKRETAALWAELPQTRNDYKSGTTKSAPLLPYQGYAVTLDNGNKCNVQ